MLMSDIEKLVGKKCKAVVEWTVHKTHECWDFRHTPEGIVSLAKNEGGRSDIPIVVRIGGYTAYPRDIRRLEVI